MFGQSGYSSAMSANLSEIERRLQSLEQRLGGRMSANGAVTERAAEAIVPMLNSVADRLHGGVNSMGDEAAKLGNEVAKVGTDALRRISKEVKHRPLVTLAVAVGVGILVGLTSRRRSVVVRASRTTRRPPRRQAA